MFKQQFRSCPRNCNLSSAKLMILTTKATVQNALSEWEGVRKKRKPGDLPDQFINQGFRVKGNEIDNTHAYFLYLFIPQGS